MKLHLISIMPNREDGPALIRLQRLSRSRQHVWTDDPAEADFIIFTDLDERDHFIELRSHPVFLAYESKCYAVYYWHEPFGFLPGIYTETPFDGGAFGRKDLYRAGLYWPASQINEHVDAFGRKPLSDHAPLPQRWLFSFMGRISHPVRQRIFKLPDQQLDQRAYLECTKAYDHFRSDRPAETTRQYQSRYVEVARQSAFVLCPRGMRKPSIRLFEMMQLGVCPVVISDGYQPPDGPEWDQFCIFVREKNVHRLWEILKSHQSEAAERGRLARAAWDEWFGEEDRFDYIVNTLVDIANTRSGKDTLNPFRIKRRISAVYMRHQLYCLKIRVDRMKIRIDTAVTAMKIKAR